MLPWSRDHGYNAYLLERDGTTILFAGDTAYTESFRRPCAGRRINIAIFPIGAYQLYKCLKCESGFHGGGHTEATETMRLVVFRGKREVLSMTTCAPLIQPDHELVSVQIQRHLVAVDSLHNRAVDIIILDHGLAVDHRAETAPRHAHDAGELEPQIVRG